MESACELHTPLDVREKMHILDMKPGRKYKHRKEYHFKGV